MIPRRESHHLGLSVSRAVIAAAFHARKDAWTDSEMWLSDEPLGAPIGRLLSRHPAPGRLERSVVALVDQDHVRVREITGLPSGLSIKDVESILRTNWSRFFVSPFKECVVATVQPTIDGWKTALADFEVVREITEACSRSGWNLATIVADPARFDLLHTSDAIDGTSDLNEQRNRAVAVSHYRRNSLVEVVPVEVATRERNARLSRIRVAASIFILTLVASSVVPRFRSALMQRTEQDRMAELSDRTSVLQAQLDSIARITAVLESVREQGAYTSRVIAQIAELEGILPDDVLLQQIRIDSGATEVAISAESVADAIKRIASKHTDIEMVGTVTSEGSPQETERVLLRIAHARIKPKTKSRGAW